MPINVEISMRLIAFFFLVLAKGFEPPTHGLGNRRSIHWATQANSATNQAYRRISSPIQYHNTIAGGGQPWNCKNPHLPLPAAGDGADCIFLERKRRCHGCQTSCCPVCGISLSGSWIPSMTSSPKNSRSRDCTKSTTTEDCSVLVRGSNVTQAAVRMSTVINR